MFTGLVEEVGTLQAVNKRGEAMVLRIRASKVMKDVQIGDSIAVNGVCLTATALEGQSFLADVMPQTFRHTTLKDLAPGDPVNLERAMLANGRFGGHIVQGHVDGVAIITNRTPDANAIRFEFRPVDGAIEAKYLIPRGSIAIDGISLTLTRADEDGFAVSIIPHTLQETALAHKHPGDSVNIECDVLGKYVEHLLRYGKGESNQVQPRSSISKSFLEENGFL